MTQFGLTMLHACGRCGYDKTNTEGIEGIDDLYFDKHMNFLNKFCLHSVCKKKMVYNRLDLFWLVHAVRFIKKSTLTADFILPLYFILVIDYGNYFFFYTKFAYIRFIIVLFGFGWKNSIKRALDWKYYFECACNAYSGAHSTWKYLKTSHIASNIEAFNRR